ncbi:MAG: hypothetical protein LM550_06365 [Candidatus Contendobacter sp.]|jgi:hypothetical protein|nr:hypothetical protein [Candidatus Contendobacter sp.]
MKLIFIPQLKGLTRIKMLETPCFYGVATTGSSWKFMQLWKDRLTIYSMDYFIDKIKKIMAILTMMANQEND